MEPSEVAKEMLLNCRVIRKRSCKVQPLKAGSKMTRSSFFNH